MLSRIQKFIEASDQRINDIQLRCNKLPEIFNRYDIAQSELELTDDTDYNDDRELFENQYYQVEVKFSEYSHYLMDQPTRHTSPRINLSRYSNHTSRSHTSSTHINLSTIALQIFQFDTCIWIYFRVTFEALFVNNPSLINIQKFTTS